MNNYVQNSTFFQVSTEKISVPERIEIEEKHTWNLKDIYENDDDWENDTPLKAKYLKIEVARAADGGANDGAWNIDFLGGV